MPKNKSTKKTKTKKVSGGRFKRSILQSVKGMHDILPADQLWWDTVRSKVTYLANYYNFDRIDTPIVEKAELFERSIGKATDVVEKQMFFIKGASDQLVLRPEATASIVRAYLEHGLSHFPQPLRLYYIGPMFRHEQPQEGRFRQFNQAGFEIVGGENDPIYDAQVILTLYRLLEELKISGLNLQVNTIGCRICRPTYRRRLVDYYKDKALCRDCKQRLAVNPLRLLDCKDKKCQEFKKEAPTVLDSICSNCNRHFESVLEFLGEVKIPYVLNHTLARGLDYYSKTVFEIFAEGFDFALAGGGRYDYLAETLGSSRGVPGVGGSVGIERLVKVMKDQKVKLPSGKKRALVFLIHIGNLAKKRSLLLIEELKRAGIGARESLGKNSLNVQLKQADKENAQLALIFGQKEAFEDSIIIRDMETGVQETVPLDKFVNVVKKKLK